MKNNKNTNQNRQTVEFYHKRSGSTYYLTPIKPERFVWHVTKIKNRQSILDNGLLAFGKLVFANNQSYKIDKFWPVMDSDFHGYTGTCGLYNGSQLYPVCDYFDFWRIDTHIDHAKWYLDPNAKADYYYFGGDFARDYICTPECILPEALSLFNFDRSLEDKVFVKNYDGVASVSISNLPLRKVA